MAASSSETVMGNVVDRLAIDEDGLAIIRSRAEWAQLFRPSEALSELPDHAGLDHIWTEFAFEEGERSVIKNGLWRESEVVCHYVSEVAVPEDVAVWVLEPPAHSRRNHMGPTLSGLPRGSKVAVVDVEPKGLDELVEGVA